MAVDNIARGLAASALVPRESLGSKLRMLSKSAQGGNAWSRPQMLSVPPWQPSTAYVVSAVIVNGGSLYVCVTGGTSASSGGPTATNGQGISDGTVLWTYFGNNQITSDPSTAQTNWAQSTAISLKQQVIANGNVYGCVVAGTTSASGTGPTGTTNAVTDGTVTWTYMGPVFTNPYLGVFPTVTSSSSVPSSPLTNIYNGGLAALSWSATAAYPIAGGSGYNINDTITIAGGAGTAAVITVTGTSGGAVTSASVTTAGAYTRLPVSPATQASTSGSGTGATFTVVYNDPLWFKVRGAHVVGNFSSSNTLSTALAAFQPNNNTAFNTVGAAVEFYSDAPVLAFKLNQNNAAITAVIIDDMRYSLNQLQPLPTGSALYYTFDFSKTSGRKARKWRLEFASTFYFGPVYIDANSQVWLPSDEDKITACVFSDSLIAGSGFGPVVVGNNAAMRLGHEIGWNNMWPMAVGGTGYCNAGTAAVFSFRLPQANLVNPDLWILMGSVNDVTFSAATVTAAVTSLLQSIRSGGSTAPIIVIGLWSANVSNLSSTETAVQAGVTAAADPLGLTFFIPITNDPWLPWVTGSWDNNPAPSGVTQPGSTNSGLYIASSPHPADIGTQYEVMRLANGIRQYVLPYLK